MKFLVVDFQFYPLYVVIEDNQQSECQYFFQNAEITRKIITIINKYMLSQDNFEIISL